METRADIQNAVKLLWRISAVLFDGSRTELTKSYDADGRVITLATPTSEAGKSNGALPARLWASECWTKCTIVL